MKIKIIGAIVIVLLIGAGYGYYQYTRGNKDLQNAKADISISSVSLLKEFSENENQANQRYLNKIIKVEGAVSTVSTDSSGAVTIALEAGDPLAQVSCQLDKKHNAESTGIRTGDTVAINGYCTGMLTDVVLIRCAVEKK